MTGAALVDAFKALLQTTLEAIRQGGGTGVLRLSSIICSDSPNRPVKLGGPSANLFHADRPLSDRVTFRLVGRVVLDPSMSGPVTVRLTARPVDNPQLAGRIEITQPLEADGRLNLELTIIFNDPTPRKVQFEVQAIGSSGVLETRTVHVELVDLIGFLETIAPREPATPSGLSFLAAVRKLLLPAAIFNLAIGRAATVTSLFPLGSTPAQRLKEYKELLANGHLVDIAHAIIGVEGAKRFDPRPRLPIQRVDLVVTWAGDLGSAVQEWIWATHYLEDPNAGTLETYLAELVDDSELLGDIDGVNLAAAYQPNLNLAENLRRYYAQDATKRFSLFIANTLRDDGSPALALIPGAPPRLTADARSFIAEQTSRFATQALVSALVESPRFPDKTYLPDPARAALEPDSSEVQRATDLFANFLEQRLKAERSTPP